jgi:hypothetical protein
MKRYFHPKKQYHAKSIKINKIEALRSLLLDKYVLILDMIFSIIIPYKPRKVYILLVNHVKICKGRNIMKRKRKSKKAPLSVWGKMKSGVGSMWSWTKDRLNGVWEYLNDNEFMDGVLSVLLGGALIFGCLDPWVAIGWLALLWGGKRIYDIVRY